MLISYYPPMKVAWLSCLLLIIPQIDGSKKNTKWGLKLLTSERHSKVLSESPLYNSSVEPSEGHVELWSAPSSTKLPEPISEREIWKGWVDPGVWHLLGEEPIVEEPGIEGRLENCFLPWRLENVCSCTGGKLY